MTKIILKFNIIHDSDIPKYQQIVNSINDGISKDVISKGADKIIHTYFSRCC